MNNNLRLSLMIALPLLLVLVFAGYYLNRPQEYNSEEFLMDTLVSISTYGTDTDLLQNATHAAFLEMRRISDLTDRFTADDTAAHSSDVNRINEMAGIHPVKVDKDVFTMIKTAQEYYQLTNGAFDITIGPLMDLWGFGQAEKHVPAEQELQEILPLVDGSKLALDEKEGTVYLQQKGMSLDLGAVAKGYAVEKAASVLKEYGITKALINAGGNIRAIGNKSKNLPWKVGIQDPRTASELVGVLDLENESATTSGDYNRTFTFNGKKYHHIISPLTGYPAEYNISVTVVSPDAFTGDLLSTALFLLNTENAIDLAENLPAADVFIVNAQQQILFTTGLKNKIEIKAAERYNYDKN